MFLTRSSRSVFSARPRVLPRWTPRRSIWGSREARTQPTSTTSVVDSDVVVFTKEEYNSMMDDIRMIDRHIDRLERRALNNFTNLAEEKRDELALKCGFRGWDHLSVAMETYPQVDWEAVAQRKLAERGVDVPLEELRMLLKDDVTDVMYQQNRLPALYQFLSL
ncbi:hypothetical protein BKA93DRAFT_925258 [Sparassis latifolia]|uniref:Uncharacterized protein n=1 Tax=Sparassis crispa TaxID=139825 RepID=A0A401H5C2_9APHY|nr:hypothetical protein SCP_1603020 [Sparassis crispa]GBE89638.1 hypothetical protein SCP_1603020 [Sparassis crispa]